MYAGRPVLFRPLRRRMQMPHPRREPKGQDEGRWTISGIVNRAFLGWDDGGQRGVQSVDNTQDSTGLLIEGEFGTEGWTSGITLGFDTFYGASDTVSQLDWNGDGVV